MRHFQKKKKVRRVIFYRVNSANSACQKKKISEWFDDQRVNSANSLHGCRATTRFCARSGMTKVPAPDIPQNDLSPFELPALTSEITEPTFELLLTLTHPPKRVRTNNRKTKNVKSESENKGPYEISVNIGWDNFLGVIAEKLMVVPSSLVITSFAWHWVKPASSPWLPVQDENGFASMLKKVKTKVEPYVIIRMSAPTERKAAESSGNAWDVVDELDSDLEDNTISKKVSPSLIRTFGTQYLAGKTG